MQRRRRSRYNLLSGKAGGLCRWFTTTFTLKHAIKAEDRNFSMSHFFIQSINFLSFIRDVILKIRKTSSWTLGFLLYAVLSQKASLFLYTWQLCNQKLLYLFLLFPFLVFVKVPCLLLLMYICIFSSSSSFVFILLYEDTKTVYLLPAHNGVLQHLPDRTGSVKSTAWRAKKQFVSTYSRIVLLLEFYSFPKGTKYVCVYVRVADLLTKGGGLQTQNEACALFVCNRGLGDQWWKCLASSLNFWFIWLWIEAKAKNRKTLTNQMWLLPPFSTFFVCFREDWL